MAPNVPPESTPSESQSAATPLRAFALVQFHNIDTIRGSQSKMVAFVDHHVSAVRPDNRPRSIKPPSLTRCERQDNNFKSEMISKLRAAAACILTAETDRPFSSDKIEIRSIAMEWSAEWKILFSGPRELMKLEDDDVKIQVLGSYEKGACDIIKVRYRAEDGSVLLGRSCSKEDSYDQSALIEEYSEKQDLSGDQS